MAPHIPDFLPIDNIRWVTLIPLLAQANYALAEYNASLRTLPDPKLLLSPLETREAVLSAGIEGTIATIEDIYRYETNIITEYDAERKDELKEILNYRNAVKFAKEYVSENEISSFLVRSINNELLQSVRGKSKNPGSYRIIQNYIGAFGRSESHIIYTPPPATTIPDYIENLINYISSSEQEIICQSGVVHAQFEIIHPFLDGNGRTGRLLIPVFLHKKCLLDYPSFYISEYLEENEKEYRLRLRMITESGEWTEWLNFYLIAVIEQSKRNVAIIRKIKEVYEDVTELILNEIKTYHISGILRAIFSMPLFTSNYFAISSSIPKASSKRFLSILQKLQVISMLKSGGAHSPAVYSFDKLLSLMREPRIP